MFCTRCGAGNPDEARFCGTCGSAMTADGAVPFHYAGFWRRFAARLLDGMVIGCVGFVVAVVPATMMVFGANDAAIASWVLYAILFLLLGWLYNAWMESSAWQATLGKRALGVYVTDAAGKRISFARATGRTLAKLVNGMTLGIGWLMAAFTEQKRGLHDYIAGTLVLRRVPSARMSGAVVGLIAVAIALCAAPATGQGSAPRCRGWESCPKADGRAPDFITGTNTSAA